MKGFTFYNNYYELIKYLPNDERYKMYDAIFQYMFENIEPNFEGLLKGLWINVKMPLDTSKNNSGRGGRKPKIKTDLKPIKNRIETDNKTDLKTNNNISYFLFLISNNKYNYINKYSNIYNSIIEWLEYKKQRKETYKEKGLESLLTQIDKQCGEHGEDNVINLITECMANNYKGIIFDKIKNLKNDNRPQWLGKKVEKQELTNEEKEEMERMLKDFK